MMRHLTLQLQLRIRPGPASRFGRWPVRTEIVEVLCARHQGEVVAPPGMAAGPGVNGEADELDSVVPQWTPASCVDEGPRPGGLHGRQAWKHPRPAWRRGESARSPEAEPAMSGWARGAGDYCPANRRPQDAEA